MSLSCVVVTDRTGLVGASGGPLAGLPPAVAAAYLLLRLLIPVLLIVLASRGAKPAQGAGLVRDYLLGAPTPPPPAALATVPSALPAPDPDEIRVPVTGDSDDST